MRTLPPGTWSRERHPSVPLREAFALECAALKRVREVMGLTNVKVMIPFCRTLGEAAGLARGAPDALAAVVKILAP